MAEGVLLYIAGLSGCVGTTVAAGVSARQSGSAPDVSALGLDLGLVTETESVRGCRLHLPRIQNLVIGGWDRREGELASYATEYGICPPEIMKLVEPMLQNLVPRSSYPEYGELRGWIEREAEYLRMRARECSADVIILANLCPTEPLDLQLDDSKLDWGSLDFESGTNGVTPSRIFFRLAIEAGAHYLNFTPNHAETDCLRDLAAGNGLLFCGRDGKTGQTFLKTTLAPALRDRHLYVNGWYSTNLLGNGDGRTLTTSGALETKQRSKTLCLESILGYYPGFREGSAPGHQVHIHYYPPRQDAKEAWDNIDFQGFLGHRMQLKLNWLGQDSILAAPLVIDLARLLVVLSEAGRSGAATELSYFFKDPLGDGRDEVGHSTPEQHRRLLSALHDISPAARKTYGERDS